MNAPAFQVAPGIGVVALPMRPVNISLAGTLGGIHRQCLAKLGGRLVEHFHGTNMHPGAPEVKS